MTDAAAAERSTSRGRETFSTGRGGIGNIRQASASRDARPTTGPDDFSVTRGREPAPVYGAAAGGGGGAQVFSTGRGGAGNLRSPSRTPRDIREAAQAEAAEQEVIREYVASQEFAVKSSGRGGIGNINRSRSRGPHSALDIDLDAAPSHSHSHSHSHSPTRPLSGAAPTTGPGKFSTGRGGAGNILNEHAHAHAHVSAEVADEEERRRALASVHASANNGGGGV
ncbi:hypothetical protein JR316_0010328 [Psilocybe cubensis]|uniref:Uncharacterized protein n=1 Tax=Psilocybe cubensis TaxID=181762 RepID=A0ACB8GQS6_PSICU|nr:hypothetical protein JR316_0010328 [Psilocybe cubensis]KAH9478090.1 hypothetical protein JR316_0010328 [Psilocybe cubensis]